MANATCSVVIPSWNCLSFLPTTLSTIALQGIDGLEVVISDDGSTDGTGEWLAQTKHHGFRLVVLNTGGVGAAGARNKAVAAATAPLVAFLDADDTWFPGKLAAQIAYHTAHPDIDLTFTDYLHVSPLGRSFGTCFEFWQCDWTDESDGRYVHLADAEAKLLATNLVGTSTVMVRKTAFEAAGGFPVARDALEDWDLWLRMAAGRNVGFASAVTTGYLMRPNSLTANRQRRIDGMRKIVDRYVDHPDPTMQAALRAARRRITVAEAEAAREDGNHVAALRSHVAAFCGNLDRRSGRAMLSSAVALTRRFTRGSAHSR